MKIALLAPISHPIPSNGYAPWEKVVYTLAQALVKGGEDVTVLATNQTKGNFKIHSTVEKTLEDIPKFGFQYEMIHITQAAKFIKQSNFDIVNNHINWYGMLPLEILEIPYVTTLHGIEKEGNEYFKKYNKANYISISYAERNLSPTLNYISNVYNGIDFNFFKFQPKKNNYFFLAARICQEKGIHNAIELAHKTNIPLYIAGIIQDQTYFKESVEPYIDNNLIKYLGNVSQEEINNYVSKALAYISLIEFNEFFGLSVAEAIACGTPILATKKGSMVELVKNGVSGFLVDNVEEAVSYVEKLKEIDPQECRRYGYNLFSIEKMIKGYMDSFKEVLNK